MTAPARVTFVCFRCEHTAREDFEKCPGCGLQQSAVPADERDADEPTPETIRLGDVQTIEAPRITSGLPDWDTATGGGFVPGMTYQVFGPPGTRKSRDLLRIASLAEGAVFISSEMGWEMLCRTAADVGAEDARAIAVYPHTELHPWPSIIALARTSRIVIVDSLSSIEKRDPVPHMTQVRTLAPHCVLIYIVQMDKEHATYAGPAALEHAVDCSIILRQQDLHTRKNRKGPAPIRTKRTTPPHGK